MWSIRRTVICLVTLVLLLLGALSAVAQSPDNTVFLPLTQRPVLPPPTISGPPSENIDITFIKPEENQLSGTELEVIVSVSSSYQSERVTAQVGDRFVDLAKSGEAYRPPGGVVWQAGWTGVLDLSDVERGSQQVVVTAIDVFDYWARAERTFVLDSPPALTVAAPTDHTVARPEVHLEARCTDDAPEGCTGLEVRAVKEGVYGADTVVAETTGNYLTETVSLEDVDTNPVRLQFIAYDAADQRTVAERFVYLEPSSHLVEIDSAPGVIWDVQPNRFLHLDTERSPVDLKILDRSTGESERAMSAPADAFCSRNVEYVACRWSRGFLSPRGAIFVAWERKLYDRADGQLELVMDEISHMDLSVAGDYAVWARRDTGGQRTLYQRDLQQGTNTVVRPHVTAVTAEDFKVTDQGEILFTAAESEESSRVALFLYQDGVTKQLTEPAGSEYEIPFALDFDGQQILYQTVFTPTETYKLKLRELTGEETTIAESEGGFDHSHAENGGGFDPSHAESEGGFDHSQINNGWVAFNRTDSSNNEQIWTRSPGGTLQQATPFNESSHLEALGPNGEVVVTVLGSRYVAIPPYDSPPVRISTSAGYPFWQGNELFVVIGRTLFGVDY